MNSLNSLEIKKSLPEYRDGITKEIIQIGRDKLMATIRMSGMSFESESKGVIDAAFKKQRGFFNDLAKIHGKNLGVWTHIVKRKDKLDTNYQFESNFVKSFTDKYVSSFDGQDFFKTDYYISFVLKFKGSLNDGITDFNELLGLSKQVFRSFDITVLKIQENFRCGNAEFLSYLLNHSESVIPMSSSDVLNSICKSDFYFGHDTLEIRNEDTQDSKYATFFELGGMPLTTKNGMWDFILSQKTEFILTQSIILMKPLQAMKVVDKQINLVSSSDNAEHEIDELNNAKDYIATGEISFGDYHFSLAVFSDTQEGAIVNGSDLQSEFLGRGTVLKRANLDSQFNLFSMLPAAKDRPKNSPRTTTNLACTFSLHNYAQGKKTGNPIGDGSALMPFKTISDSLYYFNCHSSDLKKDEVGKKFAGHTMLLGASGTGKTTVEGVITGFLTRFNPQMFTIDYNRSTELFMRAYGAEYFTIREGQSTGLNPFQLEHTPELVSFLNRLVYTLTADNQGFLTDLEEKEIKDGIDSVMCLSVEKRCLSMLLQNIQQVNLRTRLSKWCRATNGQMGWCLDAPINKFNPANMDRVGFDSTMLLEGHTASEPILATLFFLKDLMQRDGRLMLTIVEEFWMPANFPLTQEIMKKVLKAGRLKNEFMILSSQSPEDAINCDIFAAIVQQTATKIFLPNPDAEYPSYAKCNVTKSEFEKLTALDKESRTFLIKQSNSGCFAKLDLYGFDEHLPIISGTDDDIKQCEVIRAKVGDHPDNWIPEFQHYLREKKNK